MDCKHISRALELVDKTYEDVRRCIDRFDNSGGDADAATQLIEAAKGVHDAAVLSMGSRRIKRDGPLDPRVASVPQQVLRQLVPRRTYAVSVGFGASVLSTARATRSDPVGRTIWAAIAHRLTHPATTDCVEVDGTALQQGSLAASVLAARVVQLDGHPGTFADHLFFELAEYKKGEALALSVPVSKARSLAGATPFADDVDVRDSSDAAPGGRLEIAVHATTTMDAARAIEYLGDVVVRNPQKTWSLHLEAALLTAMHAFKTGCGPDICALVHQQKYYVPLAAYMVAAEVNTVLNPFDAPDQFPGQLESHLDARIAAAELEAARTSLARKTTVLEHILTLAQKAAPKAPPGAATVDDMSEAERKKREGGAKKRGGRKKKRPVASAAAVLSSDEESEGEEPGKKAKRGSNKNGEASVPASPGFADGSSDDDDDVGSWAGDDIVADDDDDEDEEAYTTATLVSPTAV